MRYDLIFLLLITLHLLNGEEVYINPYEVILVGKSDPKGPSGTTKVIIHDTTIYVKETPKQVKELVEENMEKMNEKTK